MSDNTLHNILPATSFHDSCAFAIGRAIRMLLKDGEEVLPEYAGNKKGRYRPDLYLPKGCQCLGLAERSIIEFKVRDTPEMCEQAKRYLDNFEDEDGNRPRYCLILVLSPLMFDYNSIMGLPALDFGFYTHNILLDWMIELGILGTVFMIWLFYKMGKKTIRFNSCK